MTDTQSRSRIDYRLLTDRYAHSLMDLYRTFFTASELPTLGIEFDADKALDRIKAVARSGGPPTIVIAINEESGRVIGTISWAMDTEAWAEPYAFLDKLFVLPQYQDSGGR